MNNNIVNKEDTNFKKKTDEELRKKIGKNIHLARITANFTQEQLAENWTFFKVYWSIRKRFSIWKCFYNILLM